ncbi:MAG: VWA domain-containing protein [Rhodanobacteraceae bacterium]
MNAIDFPLHFLRPWWWLAMAPLPLALWMLVRSVGGRAALARLADAALLPHLVHDTGSRKRVTLALFGLAWLLAAAAMSGPAWQKVATPLYVNGAARVVALSLSSDMLATDLKPDRMTRARFAVRDLLDDAGDARTALVAYAGAAFTVAPLTDDKRTVLNLLRALQPDVMPVPGNDAAAGIRQAATLLRQSHVQGGEIVLVTDTADDEAVEAARAAHAHGIRVDVLGVGTEQGAPVPQPGGGFANGANGLLLARRDNSALRAVARAGGGHYAVLQADGSGVAALGAPAAERGRSDHRERAQLWRDGGIWLLPALLILAALAFRRGWLLVLAVLVLPLGVPVAHAGTRWESWFSNRDQRALQALQHGHASEARKLAASPALRGAANYRAGDYADAARAFAQGRGARSRYNLGNALAKQGKYKNAIEAYRKALQRDPDMVDARANLDSVENWLKRHPNHATQQGAQSSQRSGTAPNHGSSSRGSDSQPGANHGQNSARNGAGGATPQGAQGGTRPSGRDGASAGENAEQRRQASQAAQGLARELKQVGPGQRSRPAGGGPAFALGRSGRTRDDGLNAQQRAMLHAVPDDPGALLRRKFRLEWEQRNGQKPEDRQP